MRLIETNIAVVIDKALSVEDTPDINGYNVGKVVCVGPGREDESMIVNVGDTVVFPSYNGHNIKDKDGNQITVLRQFDVLAVLD